MNQKGFIPLVFIIIGVVVVASTTFGVVKYKDKISAMFSKESAIIVSNVDIVEEEVEIVEETELVEEPAVSEKDCPEFSEQEIIYKEVIKEVFVTVPGSCPDSELPIGSVGAKTIFFNIPVFNESVSEPTPGVSSDLVIQALNFYPLELVEGEIVTFWAIIKNQGQGNAVDSSVARLSINGDFWDEATMTGLASGKAGNIVWDKKWQAISGNHTLKVCIEENNCTEINLVISRTLALPDYVIESNLMKPNNATQGDILSFSVIVKNRGSATGIGPSFASLYLDINNDGKWDITARNKYVDVLVPAGSEVELWKHVWAATKGTHKYEICADSGSNINESNETNNCVSKIFRID